ncbi:MAG: acyltransferase [Candidatus Contendobacter odensis]|uniref:Acyltransferase n=1 Tax=Candidatus Contendibacter odensensis TaxID=1400860 RepID=A0A2G6PEL5_9GAMM|nr:MAG: acyltransferase [Candidatus Contendobacter odensis]
MLIMAAIQMVSGADVTENLASAAGLLAQAADRGVQLAVLPENFALMGRSERDKLALQEAEGQGQLQDFLAEQAARHRLWLIGGTIPLRTAHDKHRIRASCLVFNDQGQRVARYDKVHLFDVQMINSKECYAESATIEAGRHYVVTDTPWGRLGLAVCYDLRFPEQFRAMVHQGMEIVALPAAFTAATGAAHWEPLLRARAIENQCYVIAAAQGGRHVNGRETFGNSLLVDPWGLILDRWTWGQGIALAKLDRAFLEGTRQQFPVLKHCVQCD